MKKEKKLCDALYQIREESISEAEAALSEAQEKINVYQANLDQNQYYADANISEKKKDSFEKAASEAVARKEHVKCHVYGRSDDRGNVWPLYRDHGRPR